jgi:uncharacterized protein
MLLIIQGTPFCNIDCSYCYLPHRDHRARLSLDLLHRLVDRLVEFAETAPATLRDDILRPASPATPAMKMPTTGAPATGAGAIDVVWHAGEPMVLPISFYEAAFAAFAPLVLRGIDINHGFQTNGTLISDPWIGFLLSTGLKLGVSIDGPRDLHDRHRRYRDGRGSFDACLAGIHRLQAAAIPFHVISVLSEPSLHEADRLFDFYCDTGLFDVGFNIEEIEGSNHASSLAAPHIPALYKAFLRRFLDRNAGAGFPVRLREAEQMAALMISGELPRNDQTEAGRILCVDFSGNVSTFSPELAGLRSEVFGDFIIGNVRQSRLADMLSGPVAAGLAAEIARGVTRCRETCDFFAFCKGGSPVNKFCETGSLASSETMHCALTVKATLQECIEAICRPLADTPAIGGLRADHPAIAGAHS